LHIRYFSNGLEISTNSLGDRNCRWKGEVIIGENHFKASRTIASYFCGGLSGVLAAYVQSKVKFAVDIKDLKHEKQMKTNQLQETNQILSGKEKVAKESGAQAMKFKEQAAEAGFVSGHLDSNDMSLSDFLATRDMMIMKDRPAGELVRVYCLALKLNASSLTNDG